MNVTELQQELQEVVDDYWRLGTASDRDLQADITRWAAQGTSSGVPVSTQLAMLKDVGIHVGGGGKGASPGAPLCPYCHATGKGGHGGMCPRGDSGTGGQPGGTSAGGGSGGVLVPPEPQLTHLLVTVSGTPQQARQVEDLIGAMASVTTVYEHGSGCCCQHCPHNGNCRD